MSWHLFDESGERAQKLTMWSGANVVTRGWSTLSPLSGIFVLGFDPERTWRPTWFAAQMSRGYRVFELDVGVLEYVERIKLGDMWQSAAPDHKRLPSMAAVEMWVRHMGARHA